MKLLPLGILWLGLAALVNAHPGIGIVPDGRGNVYFTDTKQVWKLRADGGLVVAVAGVHTHELCLDEEGILYGEHLWYESGKTPQWRHRVWRLHPYGVVRDEIPTREGFLNDFSFVRDRSGAHYLVERGAREVIKKRSPNGTISIHSSADIRAVQWMTATPDGTLFFMDTGNLRRLSPSGAISTVASRVSSLQPAPADVTKPHYHMGLWIDSKGLVCVAVAAERAVVRVTPGTGHVVLARSPAPWAPAGGAYDHEDSLWLLEYNQANNVRVRRIKSGGQEDTFTPTP